jgi:hypothetical protein
MLKNEASFRDPAGCIVHHEGEVYRLITPQGFAGFQSFHNSPLAQQLISQDFILDYTIIEKPPFEIPQGHLVIKHTKIPFISYPYEWSFSQLKDAARLTLQIQALALEHGFSLKDATFFNVQFHQGKPSFIDILSFEKLTAPPWVAYKQFCEHFLAPLALIAFLTPRILKMLTGFIDGIPLELAAQMLPLRARFKMGLLMHLFIHASQQKKYADLTPTQNTTSKNAAQGIIQKKAIVASLLKTIESLSLPLKKSEWLDYAASNNNYSQGAEEHKKQLVKNWIAEVKPHSVWDFGGNIGVYSRLASTQNIPTFCFDIDPYCVEANYLHVKQNCEAHLLPLYMDLANPSANVGWAHTERASLTHRGPADLLFALALIHHLRITNNIPLEHIARYFAEQTKYLICEFIPKSDSMVQKLLSRKADVYDDYTLESFEKIFLNYFTIIHKESIKDSQRTLFLLKTNHD